MTPIGPETGDPLRADIKAVTQRRRLALSGTRGQVAKGRDFTREALRDWGWDGHETAEDVLLIVSELLTNAVMHAGGCQEFVIAAAGDVLRIEVFDGETELPRPRPRQQGATPGGHGLYIVRRLSDRWDAQAHDHGKVVWAEVDVVRLTTGLPAPAPAPSTLPTTSAPAAPLLDGVPLQADTHG
ncbi:MULTISPECIES: ATP-binding protein [unclassified Streptomyces]|uniref:ATP-binding protein n=1 Tax=unclassified Streptomyces TaxID=2593676 RepID=UPI0022709E5C|nr:MULTISPECIES: ATP-binding protein [unclassified Streptomyces]MCY0922317.1 ATP-binding protein [Streptomyces sp. H27-G5]MCY0958837.1 ATP-binding protein [Streptomyces sp. H27-H5]